MPDRRPRITAVDLFCGVGGLSYGLQQAGIEVVAGVDIDESSRYPFEANIGATFHHADIREVTAEDLARMWPTRSVRLLAGCAPCQPFSSYRRGVDTSGEDKWPLVDEMGRLVAATLPEIVTMENVSRIVGTAVFQRFIATLTELGYFVDHRSCHCPSYGVPQRRRRRVLVASRLGELRMPEGPVAPADFMTVRQAIGELPPIRDGQEHPDDRLHKSRKLSSINLRRIKCAVPGGTWEKWPDDLKAACHRRASGATFRNVYSRMSWDEPSPTITTLAHNFGAGRFGHPQQHRAISLREAAILQSFPRDYKFVEPGAPVQFAPLGRHIGNAVPPRLAEAIGTAIVEHVSSAKAAHRPARRSRAT